MAPQDKQFIEGDRLYLREVRPSDATERYYRWMNDPDITQFLETRFLPNSMDGIRRYVESKQDDQANLFLAIILKDGERHIGNIKLGPINWLHRSADVGILVGEKDCWGKGYASEAIRLLTAYAFDGLGLNKLTAGCYAPNEGSKRAFEKVGFQVEGIRRQQRFFLGGFVDEVLLGLSRSERHV